MSFEHQRDKGAYGFIVDGVPGAHPWLIDAPAHWSRLEVIVTLASEPRLPEESIDSSRAVVRVPPDGWVLIDRTRSRATFSLPALPPASALVHPHLAAVAVADAHWRDRESFHAGGFVAGGMVWGVLGEKGAGKSSFLASLAQAGVPIVSDDVLVIDGGAALAGPRSIDLRAGAAQRLGVGEALGTIGLRERWRLALGPVEAELPFAGWIELHWAQRVGVTAKRGSERLRTLVAHRGLRATPARPQRLIELAALPVLELSRPQRWESHEDAIDALLHAVDGAGEPR